MKKLTNFLFPVFIFLTLCVPSAYSTTWIVQVSGFLFTPVNLSVTVGDSIKWQWVNGIHTTTSLTVPTGSLPWDHPIDSASTTFIYPVTVAGAYHYKCTHHFLAGMVADFNASPIGIIPIGGPVPQLYRLSQNYPNPFNPVTNIKIDIPKSAFVKLTIYNMLGSEVEVLVNQNVNAGSYSVDWNALNYTSGIYFYELTSGDYKQTKKMILVK